MTKPNVQLFCKRFGLSVNIKPENLAAALTHGTAENEVKGGELGRHQKLAFFGDAVLELVVREHIMNSKESSKKGDLSKSTQNLVNNETVAKQAERMKLQSFMLVGRQYESQNFGSRNSATAFEAVVGAIFLDFGLKEATNFVRSRLRLTP